MTTTVAPAIIRPADLAERLGIHRGTLYRWIEAGTLPRPIRLGSNSVGWRTETIEDWLAARPQA